MQPLGYPPPVLLSPSLSRHGLALCETPRRTRADDADAGILGHGESAELPRSLIGVNMLYIIIVFYYFYLTFRK